MQELEKLERIMQAWAYIPLTSDCADEELPGLDELMNEWHERLEEAFEYVKATYPTGQES